MTHTPTPWSFHYDEEYAHYTIENDRTSIAIAVIKTITPDDSAHIVHCVNTHDDLVKALEGLLDAFDCFANEVNWGASALSGSTISKVNEVPGTALAILTKAKGGAA